MSDSFATPWTVAHQAPLSMRFPRREHWSGLPFPYQGDLPDPGIEPSSPAWGGGFFTTEAPGKATVIRVALWKWLLCCLPGFICDPVKDNKLYLLSNYSVLMDSQVVLVVKNLPASLGDARGTGSIPGLGRFPGSRKWQPAPVFVPGKFHGQRSLAGYSPWGCRDWNMAERLTTHTHTHTHSVLSLFVYKFISHSLFNIIALNLHNSSMRLVSFYPFYV